MPHGAKEGDKLNLNDSWRKAMDLEVKMSLDFETFVMLNDNEPIPAGHKLMPPHCVCNAKFGILPY